jgi:hypothetical protein
VPSTAGPWPAGVSRPRSRRGPGVKPFTPDPSGPSGGDLLATVTITTQGLMRGGAGRIGTRSGLDAGGAAPHNARLPLPDATTPTSTTDPRVARQPPGALAERSGSERKPEQAAARPGRVGPA